MKQLMRFTINGEIYQDDIDVRRTLLEVLRENFGLTGTKRACNEGECGVCTVLLDDNEGVATENELHPLQQSFLDHGAFQCGFCTPGMVMTAKGFLAENPRPTEEEIRHGIAGNLCRCTGYNKYVEAILDAAEKIEE
jgi:carbon-monoxide dehydrogenase small subunit